MKKYKYIKSGEKMKTLEKVNELDSNAVDKLKQQYGIEGIILDVDVKKRQVKTTRFLHVVFIPYFHNIYY